MQCMTSALTDHSSQAPANSPVPELSAEPRFRWWPAVVILALGIICQQSIWWYLSPDRTIQVFSVMGCLAGTCLALFLWWVLGSGLTWPARGYGVLALGIVAALAASTIRL